MKVDEFKATPEASRLIVDFDRTLKAIRTQYDQGLASYKIQELNNSIVNQVRASPSLSSLMHL